MTHKIKSNLEELEVVQKLFAKLKKAKLSTDEELATVINELANQIEEKEKNVSELAAVNLELTRQIQLKEKSMAELEYANKELESFSYSVSHDLRTPLRAINGFTKIISEDFKEEFSEESMFYFEEILYNTERMGELIDNLLEFSRIAKKTVNLEEVLPSSFLPTILKELSQLEPERDVQFDIKEMLPVKGDKYMLKQAFYNLIQNAHKYTGKKEKAIIEIGSYMENENVIYYFKDNGAGFDETYSNKLFGTFQRLHSDEEFEGTGVGLAIVHKIITKHRGKIWAKSKINDGACFYISIPFKKTN